MTFHSPFLPRPPSNDQKLAELGVRGLVVNSGVPYFFCLAREF